MLAGRDTRHFLFLSLAAQSGKVFLHVAIICQSIESSANSARGKPPLRPPLHHCYIHCVIGCACNGTGQQRLGTLRVSRLLISLQALGVASMAEVTKCVTTYKASQDEYSTYLD